MNRQRALGLLGVLLMVAAVVFWMQRGGGGDPEGSASNNVEHAGVAQGPQAAAHLEVPAAPRDLPPCSLAGTVTSEAGTPIAGATVCASPRSDELAAEDLHGHLCVATDDAGHYRFDRLVPARYEVIASAPEHVASRYDVPDDDDYRVRLRPGDELEGIDIMLKTGAVELRGRVMDIGGGPVAGAWVSARPETGWWSAKASAIARSDDSGEFSLWVSAGDIDVSAEADGYSGAHTSVAAPGTAVELYLTPESVLAGRVVEAGTGRPVARARVEVEPSWFSDGGGSSSSAFTNSDGVFRMTRLKPGRYKPIAKARGRYGQAKESVLLGLGQTVDDLIIEVHPAYVVTGRIVVGEEETPCSDGQLRFTEVSSERRYWDSTEDDGSIELLAVLPGTYKVSVGCEGAIPEDEYPDMVVADSDVLEQIWRVRPGSVAIAGTVRVADGAPVSDVEISIDQKLDDPRAERSRAWETTDDDGHYEAKGLRAGKYEVKARPSGHPAPLEPSKVTVAEGESATVDITLDAGGSIAGTVVDETGKPVAKADVRARGLARWGGWRDRTSSRDDGSFELGGLRPGKYRVVASRGGWRGTLRRPGSSDDDVQGEPATVVAGKTASVRLVVENQSGTITGRVLDEKGEPVSDAFVDSERESDATGARRGSARRSMAWGWWRQPELTDTDGHFTLDELSPGTYTVRAYRRGGGEAVVENVAVGADVELHIAPSGSLSGTVTVAGGSPPAELEISLNDATTGLSRSETFYRTGGTFAIRDLPAGTYVLTAKAPEGTAQKDVTLTSGENKAGVAIVLQPKATVVGQIVDLDTDAPLAGFHMRVVAARGNQVWSPRGNGDKKRISGADGRFRIEEVQAGRVKIMGGRWDDNDDVEYGWINTVATVEPGRENDVGVLRAPRKRTKEDQRPGDLGLTFESQPPDIDPADEKLVVALVRSDGPAAGTGLEAGDVIESVGGHDVTGENRYLYYTLASVPAGQKVTLGTENGKSVTITAAPPQ